MTDQIEIDEGRPTPKQMRHWASRHGLKLVRWRKRNWREYPIFKTRKKRFTAGCREPFRLIRVLPHLDRMEICDGCMDRWANSHGAEVVMPKTQAQFDAAIETLLKDSVQNVRDTYANTEDTNA